MAGAAAKLVYPTTVNDASRFANPMRRMEENAIINSLCDSSIESRTQALQDLRDIARRNGARLPFENPQAIFQALSQVLSDSHWDIRQQCIYVVCDMIPRCHEEVDDCMSLILPQLIQSIGDRVSIRRAVLQTLHVYMKHTGNVQRLFRGIVKNGLESSNFQVKRECILGLPMLFTPESSHENFYELMQGLTKRLLDTSFADAAVQQEILLSLQKMQHCVGEDIFDTYLQRLSSPLRKYYLKLAGKENVEKQNARNAIASDNPNHRSDYQARLEPFAERISSPKRPMPNRLFEFGVVPSHVMDKLNDQMNFKIRAQAVEELKIVIRDMEETALLAPHILNFISFLNSLLDDANFKISTVTLEILGILVEKMGNSIHAYVSPMTSCLAKRMGDNKIVIRQAIMKVVMQLMQILSPKPVLEVICENLSHRNSRVRQETLNIIIASLLTFPSYDFDLSRLCQTIAPTLVDPKRQVRQAALECFSAIAAAMGNGKLQSLVQAVDSVELCPDGDGVLVAVQARLSRRQLPKLNADRLVEYATPLPQSAGSRGVSGGAVSQGPDVEWILRGAGSSTSSARSTRSDAMELESLSSARSTPIQDHSPSHGPTPRRHVSSGKARNKLPWEDDVLGGEHKSAKTDSAGSKPRQDWTPDENDVYRTPRRAPNSNSRDQSPEQGSYQQMHRAKYKRQVSDSATMPANHWEDDTSDTQSVPDWLELGDERKGPSSPYLLPYLTAWSSRGLIPLPVSPYPDDPYYDGPKALATSPIPTRPVVVGKATSSKRKVPPIPPTDRSRREDEYVDSHRDGNMENDEQMLHSLRQIRNSATKKKAAQIFERLESQTDDRSGSPGSRGNTIGPDSGIYSNRSNFDDTDSSAPFSKKKSKKTENPFESKPRLARKSTSQSSRSDLFSGESGKAPSSSSSSSKESVAAVDFQPLGGVTFRENRNSDLVVVGGGYGEDSHPVDPKPSTMVHKARERRRSTKPLLSPLGMAAITVHGQMELDDDRVPNGVVGKRMFDKSDPNADRSHLQRPARAESDPRDLPGVYGVKVRRDSLDKASPEEEYEYSSDEVEDDEDDDDDDGDDEGEEDVRSMSMSKTTREHLAQKFQQKKEEEEERRAEKERERESARKQREHEERRRREEEQRKRREEEQRKRREDDQRKRREEDQRKRREEEHRREKERQQEKLRRLSAASQNGGLSISGSGPGGRPQSALDVTPSNGSATDYIPPPSSSSSSSSSAAAASTAAQRPSATKAAAKKRTKLPSENHSAIASATTGEPESTEDLKPFKAPEQALNEALRLIANPEWDIKCTGLVYLRRLVVHHPEVYSAQLHTVNVAIIQEVKNLRSQVSRHAIVCLGDMYGFLRKAMDLDLDQTVKTLLSKSGESNGFIRADIDKTLVAMVDNVTPQRALGSLITGGASHKNDFVRKTTAVFLVDVVGRMGPGRVLSGIKDVTDRLLQTAAALLLDKNPEIRHSAQRIMHMLLSHEDFEKMLSKHVAPDVLRNVQDKIDTLKKKGLSEPPSETSSARTRRSGHGSRSNTVTRNNSAVSDLGASAGTKRRSTGTLRTDDATMEDIKDMCTLMSAADWRERTRGITQLKDMANTTRGVVGNNIVKIFDKFVPCLKDSNSKVNLLALQSMKELTPLLKDHLSNVINLTIQTVTSNLSSKNKDIHEAASRVLDDFMEEIEPTMLLQPFTSQAQNGNARIKPDMIDRVAYLVNQVHARKPKQVVLHVLPLLWHLLSTTPSSGSVPGGSGNMRTSTGNLIAALHHTMGQQLLDHAAQNSNVTPRMQQMLTDAVQGP